MGDVQERMPGDEQGVLDQNPTVGWRGQWLALALVAVMAPALVFGANMIGAERVGSDAIETPAKGGGLGGQSVSATGWHPAIEHGLGPIGPAPGASLGDPAAR